MIALFHLTSQIGRSVSRWIFPGCFLLLFTASLSVLAQDQGEGAEKEVERIEVTGSHIKRIDLEGPSPVLVIDRDRIDEAGYNSISDVLRDITENSFGSGREHSGSNAAGNAGVSLRGLGESRTLVLLNGRRLPSDPVTASVDLNLIPMAAVERVDILKDGASATYGSDALGGVVNIITKKEFNSSEVSYTTFVPEMKGGQKEELSFVTGTTTSKASVLAVINYRKNQKLFRRDREWSDEEYSLTGSPGSYRAGTIESDGTFTASGNWRTIESDCPSDRIFTRGSSTYCRYNYAADATQNPELEQLSLLTNFTYDIKDSTTLFGTISAVKKDVEWIYAPNPGIFQMPSSVADTIYNGGALPDGNGGTLAGQAVQVRYRLTELGNRVEEVEETSTMVFGGVRGFLTSTWDWEVSAGQTVVEKMALDTSGYALESKLDKIVEDGGFNFFAANGSRGSIDSAFYEPWERMRSLLTQTELKFTGELVDLPSGPVGMAVGLVGTAESYSDNVDNQSLLDDVVGNAGSNGSGSRTTQSVYTEFAMPVTPKVELQLAARYDSYSDFGSSTNPKIALKWSATPQLLFRSSFGTGFKAPSLQNLYSASSRGYPSFIDRVKCDEEKAAGGDTPSCSPAQYLVETGGNKDLIEEQSQFWNLGAVWEPSRRMDLGFDLWNIALDNLVSIDYEALTEAERRFGASYLTQFGTSVTRSPTSNEIELVEAPLQNLSKLEVFGLDLGATYRLPSSVGRFEFRVEHGHIFHYKTEGFPGVGVEDELGEFLRPQWRNILSLGYSPSQPHNTSLTFRTNAGFEMETASAGDLPTHTEIDFQYTYANSGGGKLTTGVKNLAGVDPPIDKSDPSAPTVPRRLYDQVGRTVYVGYKQLF